MKKIAFLFCAALAAVALPSCNNNDGDYPSYAYFVTVHPIQLAGSSDYYFTLDDQKTAYPSDKSRIGAYTAKEGQRAVIYFNTLSEKREGYDYNIALYELQDIYTGSARIITDPEEMKALPDDKFSYGGSKLTKRYLTSLLAYPVNDNKKHKFELIYDQSMPQTQAEEGYLDVQLRHDRGGETSGVASEYYVSFDLTELQSLLEGKKGINLRINTQLNDVKSVKIDFAKE